MSQSDQKVVQYLNEARASEIGLVSVLRSQIAMTPRGSYRDALERHLGETETTRVASGSARVSLGRAATRCRCLSASWRRWSARALL